MKRLIILTMVMACAVGAASAADIGLRGGLTANPDQIHVGAHVDTGVLFSSIRLVPNVEFGFGDNLTVIAMNGDFVYDFSDSPFSLGGELGLNYVDHDGGGSNTDFGLSVLGDYRLALASGKTLLLEIKFGLMDSPDFKATVGYSFF